MNDIDYVNCFKIYVGLKQHFNNENAYEYKGHENFKKITVNTLMKRKDKRFFVAITEKHNKYMLDFMVSMFTINPDMWIGEMLQKNHLDYHNARMGRIKTLDYIVESEINQMLLINDKTLDSATETNYNMPLIAKGKNCSLETMAVVNRVKNYTKEESINPLWNQKRLLVNNYSKLLKPSDDIIKHLEVELMR